MTQIRTVYHGGEPPFPATDQHPDAKRFYIDGATITQAKEESPDERARLEHILADLVSASKALAAAVDAIRADEEEIILAQFQIATAKRYAEIAQGDLERILKGGEGDKELAQARLDQAKEAVTAVLEKWKNRPPEVKPELLAAQVAAGKVYAAAFAKDIDAEQRAFLARITDAQARQNFIDADRKVRAQIMQTTPAPAYVVDAVGGKPTAQEIDAIVNPPPPPTPARQAVDMIKSDPQAVAALKAAIASSP